VVKTERGDDMRELARRIVSVVSDD